MYKRSRPFMSKAYLHEPRKQSLEYKRSIPLMSETYLRAFLTSQTLLEIAHFCIHLCCDTWAQ